jgi:phosphoglycerol transferase
MEPMNANVTEPARFTSLEILEASFFPKVPADVVPRPSRWRTLVQACSGYALAVVLCAAILFVVLQLWWADLRVPLIGCNSDNRLTGMLIKSITEGGWYLHNDRLGSPYGLDMHDFPMADSWHFLLIKLLALFIPDAGMVQNSFFLLTFPLTTVTSLFVLRRFGISYPPALGGSLLYSFLYYHFGRGTGHLCLAAYYLVPLMGMVILWQFHGEIFGRNDGDGASGRSRWLNRRSLASLAICVLMSSGGTYYAFFGCYFVLVTGIAGVVRQRTLRPLLRMTVLIGVIAVGTIANVAPSLLHQYQKGSNLQVVDRPCGGAEIYGLKIAQLVLPNSVHRFPPLNKLKTTYNVGSTPLINENDAASLGIIGSIGFLALLVRFLFQRPSQDAWGVGRGAWGVARETPHGPRATLDALGLLTMAGVLLATVGGFGVLFALAGGKWFRGYNRICVYLAFFALVAVVMWLDRHYRKWATTRKSMLVAIVLLGLLTAGGILDQTSGFFLLSRAAAEEEYRSDDEFVRGIEDLVPDDAMIFQLPYVPFPEGGQLHQMADYDLFKGYLHSNKLRWSYGTIKGREGDCWQQMLAARPVDELVKTLAWAGYSGIYLDRYGCPDRGAELEKQLAAAIDCRPLVSRDQRLAFYYLTPFACRLQSHEPPVQWPARREQALYPLMVLWKGGFSGDEGGPEHRWRWCSTRGELHIINPSRRIKQIAVQAKLRTGHPEPANLSITGSLGAAQLVITNQQGEWNPRLTIPPGKHVVKFECDGEPMPAPGDPRRLVFTVEDFRLQELDKELVE